jgi:REP element-mobilizing transposase RayT
MAVATARPLRTNNYFVATVGGATPEVVKRYVENQHSA